MKFPFRFVVFLFYFVLVFPFFFLPFGFDYSIFFVGGKIIANGGKLFVDFIDIKPPLIYYFFAVLYILFDNNLFLYQVFNTIVLLATSILTFEVANSIFKNRWIALLAPVPMILFAASFNYNYIFEPELFLNFVLMISTFLLFKKKESLVVAIALGFLSGIAFGLKYTFGVILLPIIIYFYNETNPPLRKKQILFSIIAFIITTALPFVVLFFQNWTFKGFANVVSFINYYQSTGFFSPKSLVRIPNNIEIILGVFYSLSFSIAFFYGVWNTFLSWKKLNRQEQSWHSFLLLCFFFLFFSIVVEHQFLNYHFLRLASILSIYSGYGIYLVFTELPKFPRTIRSFLILALSFIFVFYTPIPRYIRTLIPTYYFFTNKEKYIDYFENKSTAHTLLRQHTTIATLVNQNLTADDTVVIVGGAAQIYTMLKDCKFSAFPTSVFVLSRFKKPKEWEERFLRELNTAKYLIVQDYDHTHFFGEEVSSWEAFNRNPIYKNILEQRYELVLKTFSFYVYRKKE